MNYDSRKLSSGVDASAVARADQCSEIEAMVDSHLGVAIYPANLASESQWSAEPVLAEADPEGDIVLEVNLRLKRVPVSGKAGDLLELVQAILNLGNALAQVAENKLTVATGYH